MHLIGATIQSDRFPESAVYPFNLPVLKGNPAVAFTTPITFFLGENGSGKSTLLRALARACGVHVWNESYRARAHFNPHEDELHRYLDVAWNAGPKPGALFSSETYQHLTLLIDEWASTDPKLLDYFGGKSLVEQSHGESFMAYYRSRYSIEGIYFLDEPETALSPRRQILFLSLLREMAAKGHAQFIIATHSPILLSCAGARLLSFDGPAIREIKYEETDYYRVYRDFLNNHQVPEAT